MNSNIKLNLKKFFIRKNYMDILIKQNFMNYKKKLNNKIQMLLLLKIIKHLDNFHLIINILQKIYSLMIYVYNYKWINLNIILVFSNVNN